VITFWRRHIIVMLSDWRKIMKRSIFFVLAALALGLAACSETIEETTSGSSPDSPAPIAPELRAEIETMSGLELVEYLKGGPQAPGFAFADERLSSMLFPGMEDEELLAAAKDLGSETSTSGRKAFNLR
jgi:hypothetical protein